METEEHIDLVDRVDNLLLTVLFAGDFKGHLESIKRIVLELRELANTNLAEDGLRLTIKQRLGLTSEVTYESIRLLTLFMYVVLN